MAGWKIVKDMKGNGHKLLKVLFKHFLKRLGKLEPYVRTASTRTEIITRDFPKTI